MKLRAFENPGWIGREMQRAALVALGLGFGSSAWAQAPAPEPAKGIPTAADAMVTEAELVRSEPGGLTPEDVGARAAATSYSAKAAEAQVRAAAERVDQAWFGFLPRLSATARYTRLSDFTPPSFGASQQGSLVGTLAPPGTLNPTPTTALPPFDFSFPLVLDQFLIQASILVPVSDYFLRINQNYTAQTHAEEAARHDTLAARAKSLSDGKAAYYAWVRARGSVTVAERALGDQRTHLADAKNLFQVGTASRADVLRAETAVAAAEFALERAKNLVAISEKQVRIAMHVDDDKPLVPGESLTSPPPPVAGSPADLTREAFAQRPEVHSIDANAKAALEQAKVARAGRWPTLGAFGDAILGNPNPRRFPQTNEWFPTWQVGAQASWAVNDFLVASPQAAEIEARAASLEEQKGVVRDGISLEVTQAWRAIREAEVAEATSQRELASATEAYRVARELFLNGRATSTTLTDAETELTRARLDRLNALVDARVARVRLDHATGRDVRAIATSPAAHPR